MKRALIPTEFYFSSASDLLAYSEFRVESQFLVRPAPGIASAVVYRVTGRLCGASLVIARFSCASQAALFRDLCSAAVSSCQ